MARSIGWLILIALACGLLGYLVGRQTAPGRHGAADTAVDPVVEMPSTAEVMRLWPTVWPDGGAAIRPELDPLLRDELTDEPASLRVLLERQVQRRADRIRSRVALHVGQLTRLIEFLEATEVVWSRGPGVKQHIPLIHRLESIPVDLARPRFRNLADAIAERVPSGFSMGSQLKFSSKQPRKTPFGAYFQHGFVHDLVGGRWLPRRTPPWRSLRRGTP